MLLRGEIILYLIERLELAEQILAERENIFIETTWQHNTCFERGQEEGRSQAIPYSSSAHVVHRTSVLDNRECEDKEADKVQKGDSDDEVGKSIANEIGLTLSTQAP
jgi:hypothetical protein